MSSVKKRLLGVGLLAALCAPAAQAIETGGQLPLEQVYDEAQTIVMGTVTDQVSYWEEYDGNRIIFTYTSVRVQGSQKAPVAPGTEIVVRSVGGKVGDYRQVLVGEVNLTVGEEVVLFLAFENEWIHPSVVGYSQGKYRVERAADGRITGFSQHVGQNPGKLSGDVTRRYTVNEFVNGLRAARLGRRAPAGEGNVHVLQKVR